GNGPTIAVPLRAFPHPRRPTPLPVWRPMRAWPRLQSAGQTGFRELPNQADSRRRTFRRVLSSWQFFSNGRKVSDGRRNIVDNLNLYCLSRKQFRNPGCSSDSIVDHQFSVRAAINTDGWHTLGRFAVLPNLPLQFEGI